MDLRKNHIYRYKEEDNTPLCVYLCDTQAKDKILIIPLAEENNDNAYKLSVTKQYALLTDYKEISKADIVAPLYLGSKPVRLPTTDITVIQQSIISDMMSKISADACLRSISLPVFEAIYQFLKWKWEKLLLNFNDYQKKTTVFENGIYWASLGVNVGSELNKNRPVLIWKKRVGGSRESEYSYIVIPITSKFKSQKYYMNVPIELNGRTCYLRIEDMRRINIKRISRPILDANKNIIFISTEKRQEIIEAIKRFYIFDNMHISR